MLTAESTGSTPFTGVAATKENFTARDWFSRGERIAYDPEQRLLLETAAPSSAICVFRRVEGGAAGAATPHRATFLPGFPDGSFGWARVLPHLPAAGPMPKLFVEYVGQGDSDKPRDYPYSVRERADIVEAHWRDLGVKSADIVSFDFSSLVTMELLNRQIDRIERGDNSRTIIKHVVIINGGLFADAHSHPWYTTPLLKTPMGRVGTWFAQRSKFIFGQMVNVLWSKEYGVTRDEVGEMFDAITSRDGAVFMSLGAGFVDEHKANTKHWDFKRLYLALQGAVSFLIVGSEQDPFERKQIVKARKRLGDQGLDVRTIPGGHLSTSEQPRRLAALINESLQTR